MKKGSTHPVRVELRVNSKPLKMEVYTGAVVSIISQKTWQEVFPLLPIEKSSVVLTTYSSERLKSLGRCTVNVSYKSQQKKLFIYMYFIEGDGPS